MSNPISTDPPAQFFREVSIDHTSPAVPSKCALAIRHGAIEIDDKELVAIIRPQWAAFEQHRDLGGRPQPESEHPRKLSHARNS
jgi:hypothetical protein